MKKEIKEVIVSKNNFAIIKAEKIIEGAFANIMDNNETTVIISEDKVNEDNNLEIQRGFKLITFNMVLPFSMVGFIARISQALAKEKIPIFVISAYSTDHILIREEFLQKANKILVKLGFTIKK